MSEIKFENPDPLAPAVTAGAVDAPAPAPPSPAPPPLPRPVPDPWRPVALATLVGGSIRFWYALVYHQPWKYLYSDMLANVMRAYAAADPHHVPNPWDTFVPRGIVEMAVWALKLFPDRSVETLTPVQALLSTLCIPLAYVGLRRCFGARPALLAAWLLALDYLPIGYTGYYLAENYLMFFVILSLALLRPEKPLWTFFAGLCLGVGSWYKAQAFTLLPFWALALWWAGHHARVDPHAGERDPSWPASPPRRLSALTLTLGALLFVVPESVLVSRIAGRPLFMSSNGGQNFYSGHCAIHLATCTGSWGIYAGGLPKVYQRDEGWPDVSFTAPFYDSPFYLKEGIRCSVDLGWKFGLWMVQQLADTFAGWPGSTIDVWPDWATDQLPWARGTNLVISYLFYPLALWSLWRMRKRLGAWLGFGLPFLSVIGIAVLFLGDPRFRQPYDFFMLGPCAVGMLAVWDGERRKALFERFRARWQALPIATPAAACARFLGKREVLLGTLAFLALGAWMSAPLWGGVWFDAHEYSRYVSRTIEYLRDLRDGTLFPRWAPDFYGGFGTPFFDFYPPGVFASASLFALLGVSVTTALKLVMLGATVAGGVGAFELVRRETGRADAGLVAGAAFTFAPYRFVDLFLRGDLAEYAAIALLPWMFLYYRELTRASRERLPRTAFLAALCHAGVLLCHTVIGQWATEAVFALALVPALADGWRGRRLQALGPLAAMGGALGLSAIYVLPALAEKSAAHLERMREGYNSFSGHMVPALDYLKFSYYGWVGDFPPSQRMPFSVGVPLAAAAVLGLACLFSPRARRILRSALPFWIGTLALLWVMTPSAQWVYRLLPLAEYIQFPWRLLGLTAAFGAGVVGITWAAAVDGARLSRARWPLAILAVLLIGLEARRFEAVKGYYAPAQIPASAAAVAATMDATTSEDSHLPRTAPRPPPHPRTQLAVASPGVEVRAEQRSGTSYLIDVDAKVPGTVDVQILDFPGWRAKTLEGPGTIELSPSPAGLTRLAIAAPGHYQVSVWFGTTPARTAAAAISLLTLLLFLPLLRLAARLPLLAQQPLPAAPEPAQPAPSTLPSV
ncbi:MAG: 6-pyruvoyl-tetrahydropterin synthase-related protein [Myxococcales bacterium]